MDVDACRIGPLEFEGPAEVLDMLGIPAVVIDAEGTVSCANIVWAEAFGQPPEGRWAWLAFAAEESRPRLRRALAQVKERQVTRTEVDAHRKDGTGATFECVLSRPRGVDGEAPAVVMVLWDVTERRMQERRLAFMAGHDPLTGMANRRSLEEALDRAVVRAERGAESVLMMIDLDHLKSYNDDRGHLAGDQALVNFAMMLRTHVRASDLPARMGGDEFAVLLEDATMAEAAEIAERMRHAASGSEFVPDARKHRLGMSAGLAFIEPGVSARVLLDRADCALYAAKALGRNRVEVWRPGDSDEQPERVAERIHEALGSGGLFLMFQPVSRLSDGRIEYFESLIRMEAADGEVYAPDEFLPVAERLGLMSRITRVVVRCAIDEIEDSDGHAVSVNLSASDLGDEHLLEDVAALVKAARIEPRCLVFEVSEPALLSNLTGGRQWMERLGGLGCRFVLDDFGSGVGIFVLLRESAIEQVKLSRTVVHAFAEHDATAEFVGALRELIESQGKVAVATYLETAELLGEVRRAGFTIGQGFELSEPRRDIRGFRVAVPRA